MEYMFYSCKNLKKLYLNSFNTENCKNFFNIFGECNDDLKIYLNPLNNSEFIKEIEKYVNIVKL